MQEYHKGRGAQFNTKNRFLKNELTQEHTTGIDDWEKTVLPTQYIEQESKSIVNTVDSPDIPMPYSMNPYAGCEHGCIYCYARNAHEYWGYSAGIDFEQKIIVKKNAVQLLRQTLLRPGWQPAPIILSGNTDCYQPAEKKFRLTLGLLKTCNTFNQPVGILTKNALILRDKLLLQEMAAKKIVSVRISFTSLNENLRRSMEPRTVSARQKLKVIETLSKLGVNVGIIMGPIIPGLNDQEMQAIMKAAAEHGAANASYTFIRLNGAVKLLFHDWLYKNFPDRADKVWHLMQDNHGGKVNDTDWGKRMRGEGVLADLIAQQHKKYCKQYGLNQEEWEFNQTLFARPGQQRSLF
jgi:DNA repair photolyase